MLAKVIRGSGDPIFDRSAENAVRKASPLPFPDDSRCYEFIKEFNFEFNPDG
jgi:colicin import membrane protein